LYLLESGEIKGQKLAGGQWVIADAEAQRWLKLRRSEA